ncbi:unnamed protein product, partial [marine sediment metagenome]
RVEEVGGFFYRVEGGDLAITDGVANDIKAYIHIKDDGVGGADAFLSVNSGVWDANKGGYYHTDGAKVIMALYKATGPIYSKRGRMLPPLNQEKSVGEIFGLHPDVKILPNPFNFSPCDGVESVDTDFIDDGNDANVPDLTDDRFLMGGSAWAEAGTNTKNITHTHSHQHKWFRIQAAQVNPDQSHDSNGTLQNFVGRAYSSVLGGATLKVQYKDASVDHLDRDYYTDTQAVSGGPSAQDILPQYFKVLFYIRIR